MLIFFCFLLFLILIPARCHQQETKSVGAEVNWGVRFNDIVEVGISQRYFDFLFHNESLGLFDMILLPVFQCEKFLLNLCREVSFRLQECGVEGRTITLKVLVHFSLQSFQVLSEGSYFLKFIKFEIEIICVDLKLVNGVASSSTMD